METPGEITIRNALTAKLETYNVHTGELIAREGDGKLVDTSIYSTELAYYIASLVREGKTVKSICSMPGMPNVHIIYFWQSLYPDFKKLMHDAREDRADYYHDVLVDDAEKLETLSDEQYRAKKMKHDTLKWAAEKGNSTRYGSNKAVVTGNGHPLQIIVNTGIIREKEEPTTITITGATDGENKSTEP